MNFINNLIVCILPFTPKSIIKIFAKNYVAGVDSKHSLNVIKKINTKGIKATIDILGEHTNSREECLNITNHYIGLLENIEKRKLECNLSIKPSHIGSDINFDTVLKNFKSIHHKAINFNNFIRIDMESSKLTNTTIKLYNTLKSISSNIGIVFQAYLYRTEQDILKLKKGDNIRLCKGIYKEDSSIAYTDYNDINTNYLKLLKIAFKKEIFVGIATHDPILINKCIDLIKEMNINSEMFEFQYLYGVPMDKAMKIIKSYDYNIRCYVPYGDNWYDYSIRRIKENPKIASYVIRNIFK